MHTQTDVDALVDERVRQANDEVSAALALVTRAQAVADALREEHAALLAFVRIDAERVAVCEQQPCQLCAPILEARALVARIDARLAGEASGGEEQPARDPEAVAQACLALYGEGRHA